MDKDTRKSIEDGQKVEDWINSEGWQVVKRKLLAKLATLSSVRAIPLESRSAEAIGLDALTRAGAVEMILEWINEIEGQAVQSHYNREQMQELEKDNLIIKHYGD